jgi:hypothetical protein
LFSRFQTDSPWRIKTSLIMEIVFLPVLSS